MAKIKVLIIDDSLLVRSVVTDLLQKESDIEVIATGKTGLDCVELTTKLQPDIIVLDIEMPVMNGLAALEELKKRKLNVPAIMLSVLTQHGADATFKALELGAIDFIPKPSSTFQFEPKEIGSILITKIRDYFDSKKTISSRGTLPKIEPPSFSPSAIPSAKKEKVQAVVIGTSTGGPRALQTVISGIPANFKPPIFIVQHMPAGFTKAFSERMNSFCPIQVKEAEDGESVKESTVYIAPGDFHMKISKKPGGNVIELDKMPTINGHRPSIEATFDSARSLFGASRLVAVIMTGMGKDGSEAIKAIRSNGGTTLAQDESTSVVFGMNRQAIEIGGIDYVLKLEELMPKVVEIQRERGN